MLRFRNSFFAMAIALVASSCAFEDGDPWGSAEFHLDVTHDNSARIEDGKFKTSKDYLLEITDLRVGVATMSLSLRTDGGGTVRFDPANPPAGYSLCHAGHCHADDGSLVPYEEIEAELNGVSSTGPALVQDFYTKVAVIDGTTSVEPGTCTNACDLERGELSAIDLVVGDLVVEGRVFDARAESRLPAEGIPISGRLVLNQTFTHFVSDQTIGEGEPIVVAIDATWEFTNQLFDGVDFEAYAADESIDIARDEIATTVSESIATNSTFNVTIERRDTL